MAFAMPLVIVPTGRKKWVNAAGRTECVEFVRQATGAPPTGVWKAGVRVRDALPGTIAYGAAIATFVDGHYPHDSLGQHAAIYLRHDAHGIRVLDQWNLQGEVRERTIRFEAPAGTRRSNDGDAFYVIE